MAFDFRRGSATRALPVAGGTGEASKGRAARRRSWIGRRFWRDESGSTTVEAVIWVPIFVLIMVTVADISFMFTTNASMWDTALDTSRRLARHQLDSNGAVSYARNELLGNSRDYSVQVQETYEDVTVTITLPISEAGLLGVVAAAWSGTVRARVSMLREPV